MDGLQVPIEHVLLLAACLFSCGLLGLMLRRNIIFMLMSLEVMLNSAGLAFIAGGARWAQADGQIIFLRRIRMLLRLSRTTLAGSQVKLLK